MTTVATTLIQHPKLVALGLAMVTLVALFGCLQVATDPSNEPLFLRQSDTYRVYTTFRDTFGSDETVLVALHDQQHSLLQPDGLAAIRALTQALRDVPHVTSISSLVTARDIARLRVTRIGLIAPLLIENKFLSETQLAAIRTNDLIIGTLLSADLRTAAILVTPDPDALAPTRLKDWTASLREVAAHHATHGRSTYVAGTPIEYHDVAAYLQRDQQLTVPLVFIILLGITIGIYRHVILALIPLAAVLLALCWTMGVVGFSGLSLNIITSLLPPVIMVVTMSAAIHLLNPFLAARAAGHDIPSAAQHTIEQVGMACWLTAFTTMMGFFSLLVSPVPAVQEFALFAGIGVIFAFTISITLVPLALLKLGHLAPIQPLSIPARLERGLTSAFRLIAAHRIAVCVTTLTITALFASGIPRLSEGTDIVRSLKPSAPLRLSTEFIDQHLNGVNSLELMLALPATGTTPAVIRQVLDFSNWLHAQPGITTVYSPWELLRGVPATQRDEDDELWILATLLPISLPLQRWINTDAHALRISVRVNAMGSDRLLALAQQIRTQARRTQLTIQLTGTNLLLAQMSRTLVATQIRSLLLAMILILGSIGLILRSWKLGLVAAIPNLLPLLMLFGLMGWAGIMLSTATTMIASVALGLIVDDTIHLLYRFRQESGQDAPVPALERAIGHTGPALVITTVILTLGFWAGLTGSFKPTVSFAFLTGLTMVLALLTDLIILPAVLLIWEKHTAK